MKSRQKKWMCVVVSVILMIAMTATQACAVTDSFVADPGGTITVTYGMGEGEQVEIDGLYYLFVVKGIFPSFDLDMDYDYNYMGQVTAQDYSVEFSFRLRDTAESTVFISSNRFDTPILLGYIRGGAMGIETPDRVVLKYKQSQTLEAKVKPDGVEGYEIKWMSADDSVISVDEAGTVKAVGKPHLFRYLFHREAYTVTITATVTDFLTGQTYSDTTAVQATYTIWQLLFPFFTK